jgi:hypothetical protein
LLVHLDASPYLRVKLHVSISVEPGTTVHADDLVVVLRSNGGEQMEVLEAPEVGSPLGTVETGGAATAYARYTFDNPLGREPGQLTVRLRDESHEFDLSTDVSRH